MNDSTTTRDDDAEAPNAKAPNARRTFIHPLAFFSNERLVIFMKADDRRVTRVGDRSVPGRAFGDARAGWDARPSDGPPPRRHARSRASLDDREVARGDDAVVIRRGMVVSVVVKLSFGAGET